MNNKTQRTILAGIIGTVIMTLTMMISPLIGMPKMSAPALLSETLGAPIFIGWVMHFMTGILFAFACTYLCIFKHKIKNVWLKGAVFGAIIFIVAQIMMAIMGMIMPMPKMEGSLTAMMVGSLSGHIIFGMAVAKTVGNVYCTDNSCTTKTP